MSIRLINKNYLWLIFETTTNEFLSSDRHVIKDIIILPLLFFGFPYLFKIRQIKYPAYYTIWNDRFDAIFCNKQHFRNFVTCSCLPRYNFIWTNTRSRQNIFAKKRNLLLITIINTMFWSEDPALPILYCNQWGAWKWRQVTNKKRKLNIAK